MSSGNLRLLGFSACGLTSGSVNVRGQLSGITATLGSFVLEDLDKPTPGVDVTVQKP